MTQIDPSATSGPESFPANAPQYAPHHYAFGIQSPAQQARSNAIPELENPANFKNPNLPSPQTRPDLNDRVYRMLMTGAKWMPLQVLYGFADSGISDDELSNINESIRQLTIKGVQGSVLKPSIDPAKQGLDYQQKANEALAAGGVAKTDIPGTPQPAGVTAAIHGTAAVSAAQQLLHQADDGFKHFWDDPVLQKHPSAALVLKSYLSNVLGPAPVSGGTLKHSQVQLQAMGFGQDLKADGTMSPGWGGAFAEWKNSIFRSQLSGNRPGSISVDHALKALSAITPGEAWPALYNFIKSIPAGGRQLLADVAGSFAGLQAGAVQSLSQGNLDFLTSKEGTSWQRSAHGGVASYINNNLAGNTQTPEQNLKDFQENFGTHLLEDGINAIMLGSTISSISSFADAAGMERLASTNPELAANLTRDAAAKGPGVMARSLSSEVPGTTVWEHLPVLKNIGPIVNSLTDADGLYYQLRSFAHAPWTWVGGEGGAEARLAMGLEPVSGVQGAMGSALRLGDVAFQQSLLRGGEAQGLGQVDQWLSGGQETPFQKNLNKSTPIDELNDALKTFNVAGTHPLNLDDLMFVFGGAGAHALHQSTSETIGRSAASLQKTMINTLHETGISEGVSRLYDGKSIKYISKMFGGTDNFAPFIWGKIYDEAAWFAAQNEYDRKLMSDGLPVELSSSDRVERIRSMADGVRNDPEQLHEALGQLMSQGGGNELYVRLHHDMALDPKAWDPEMVKARLAASDHVRENIMPWADTRLGEPSLEPQGGQFIAHPGDKMFPQGGEPQSYGIIPKDTGITLQQAHAFNQDMEEELASIRAREAYNPDETMFSMRQTSVGEQHLNPATPSPGARPTYQDLLSWNERMDNHLRNLYGISGTMMPQTWEDKLSVSKSLAEKHLPIALIQHPDAPAALNDAMQQLNDMGYTLVNLKDMGHRINDIGPMEELKGGLTFRRKLAETIGMNPDNIFDATVGQEAQNQILGEIKKAMDNKGVQLGPGQTPASILKILRSHGVLPESGLIKGRLREFLGSDKSLKKLLDADVEAMTTQLPLRDARRKDIVEKLMDPEIMASHDPASYDLWQMRQTAENMTEEPPWMSERDANLIAHAIVKGYAKVPTAFTGLNHIEDMFRGIGFMGLGMENKLGYAMSNLPNRLIQIRNQIRFDLSPMFDFRRVFKTNVKMATMGIPPSWDPIKALVQDGAWEQARQALIEARPTQFKAEALGYADNADRYLAAQGVFHYNQLGYETYAAYWMKKDGMVPAEIDKNLTKMFQYGNRTGMERSMNFVFFPFSFEKSLYKLMGTYILDQPAQRLILTQGMAAYDQFNKEHMDGSNPLATSFYNKHLPLFSEAARINAFTQGISLGEPGGVNRPLLNLFLPQSWSPTSKNQDLLEEWIPALKDFSRVYQESLETAHISRNWADNLYNEAVGNKPTVANPRKSTLTAGEDLSAGFDMYLKLTKQYHQHIVNGDTIPVSPEWGEFSGKTITNQVIRQMVAKAHPAYSAEGAATYVITQNQNFDSHLNSIRGTPQADGKYHGPLLLDGDPAYAYEKSFREAVNNLGYDLAHSENPASLAGQTKALREAAMYIAERDADFYKLYPKTFGRILGPLEAVQ